MSSRKNLSEQDLPPGTIPLVKRLQAASAEVAEELADAVAEAVPERHREATDRECRPLCRTLVPVALDCVAQGSRPDEGELHPIRLSARRTLSDDIPASVTLTGIRAAMARFSSIVARHAAPHDVLTVVTLMGRAAVLLQLFVTVFVSGSEESAPRPRPGWWSEQPSVAKESLRLVTRGCSTAEIARELNYSEQAITYHLGKLMRLFGCSNRAEMVSRAHEVGVIGDSAEAAAGGDFRRLAPTSRHAGVTAGLGVVS